MVSPLARPPTIRSNCSSVNDAQTGTSNSVRDEVTKKLSYEDIERICEFQTRKAAQLEDTLNSIVSNDVEEKLIQKSLLTAQLSHEVDTLQMKLQGAVAAQRTMEKEREASRIVMTELSRLVRHLQMMKVGGNDTIAFEFKPSPTNNQGVDKNDDKARDELEQRCIELEKTVAALKNNHQEREVKRAISFRNMRLQTEDLEMSRWQQKQDRKILEDRITFLQQENEEKGLKIGALETQFHLFNSLRLEDSQPMHQRVKDKSGQNEYEARDDATFIKNVTLDFRKTLSQGRDKGLMLIR
jgi:hypothetical protein